RPIRWTGMGLDWRGTVGDRLDRYLPGLLPVWHQNLPDFQVNRALNAGVIAPATAPGKRAATRRRKQKGSPRAALLRYVQTFDFSGLARDHRRKPQAQPVLHAAAVIKKLLGRIAKLKQSLDRPRRLVAPRAVTPEQQFLRFAE